jgi:cysteine-rich repeat protein
VSRAGLTWLAAGALAALALAGCGGGAVCGDGKAEDGEPCDDGNDRDDDACSNSCEIQQTLDAQIIWTLIGKQVAGFQDNCQSVGADKIRLEISGPLPVTQEVDCAFQQYPFPALRAGSYTVNATLLDAAGQALTKGLTSAEFTIATTDVQVELDFPFEDFNNSYVGNWFYRFKWAGSTTCQTSTPPVKKVRIRLERDGQPLMTTMGKPVDGNMPLDCVSYTEIPAAIKDLPWGPATLKVTGLDDGDKERFAGEFPTFVGAGVSNPPLDYDMASLVPDAGM